MAFLAQSILAPHYISDLIDFLVEGKSSWINGAIIPVDGGHSLK